VADENNQENETLNLEETRQQNEELYQELTNKNQDYMFQLNSRLEELDYDPVKKAYIFNDMIHEMLTAEESSIPGKRIYGTVTEQADNILGKDVEIPEEEKDKSPLWMRYMDGALLLGGLFSLVNGFGAMQEAGEPVGIFQVLLNFLFGGLAVLALTKYAPKPGQTKGMLKYIGATLGVMFAWVFALTGALLVIPDVINPAIPGGVVLGIGAVALVAKWYLKRKLDIEGTLF